MQYQYAVPVGVPVGAVSVGGLCSISGLMVQYQ